MNTPPTIAITCTVNGRATAHDVPPNRSLAEFLRDDCGLTGTNVSCNTGDCGACTVLVDGRPITGCLVLAAECDGAEITTIEGLATVADGNDSAATLHPMQEAFLQEHGAQCGFCTPGMVMAAVGLLHADPNPDESAIRAGLEGNLCRCTGYTKIVSAVQRAAARSGAPSA